eukprot:6479120-Amphidinium_carterae.1
MMRAPLSALRSANVPCRATALSKTARRVLQCPTHACKPCSNSRSGTSEGGQCSSSSSGPTPSLLPSLPGCVS